MEVNAEYHKINGVLIKRPSTFKIERYNLTTLNRLANGDQAGDLIAKKRKFYFTYEAISSKELDVILDAIWETNSIFYTYEYTENNIVKTNTVYSGSIPTTFHRSGYYWVWKEMSFNLIEK